MSITILSSHAFNQDPSAAKTAAKNGPVFITDHGRPAYVLLTMEDYQKLTGSNASIIDLLALTNDVDELEPVRVNNLFRPADLS